MIRIKIFKNQLSQDSIYPCKKQHFLQIHSLQYLTISLIDSKYNCYMPQNQIVIVGAAAVGKSSILGKLEKGDYVENRYAPTLGIVAHKLTLEIDGKNYSSTIYDSQGFDNNPGVMFIPLFKRYSAFIIVYDITDLKSFNNAKQCVDEIRKLCSLENQYILVLGNKDDLEQKRKVTTKQAMKYFDSEGIQFSQISAKQDTPQSIRKIFKDKLRLLLAKRNAENQILPVQTLIQSKPLKLSPPIQVKNSSKCC